MASEAIKKFMLQQMFKRSEQKRQAKDLAESSKGLMGQAPIPEITSEFGNDQMFPGEQPIQGLMNIEQQGQEGTGMFDTEVPVQQRIMEFNQRRMQSMNPELQNRAAESTQALEANMLSGAGSAGIQRQRYDPNTDVSINSRARAGELFPNVNFDGLSAVDVMGMMKTLQAQQRIEDKPEAAKTLADSRINLEAVKAQKSILSSANNKLLSVYQNELEQSNKYKPTLDTTNRILDLGSKVETGKFAGSVPVVWLREMFGDTELQELNSLIKGLPLPILKATFGAAFSVKEGETLATSLANVGMDAKTFEKSMNRLKSKLIYDERRFKSKQRYFQKYQGNLMGYKDKVPYPKDLKSFEESEKVGSEKTVSWSNL